MEESAESRKSVGQPNIPGVLIPFWLYAKACLGKEIVGCSEKEEKRKDDDNDACVFDSEIGLYDAICFLAETDADLVLKLCKGMNCARSPRRVGIERSLVKGKKVSTLLD